MNLRVQSSDRDFATLAHIGTTVWPIENELIRIIFITIIHRKPYFEKVYVPIN